MNTDENKALIEAIFEKLSRGDGSMFIEHLADDVVQTVTGKHSWSKVHKGKEALIRDVYGYLRTLVKDTGKTQPLNIIAGGDWVVVEARGDMITKEGVPYQNDYCLIYRLEGGKIVEIKEYMDSVYCEQILGTYPASLRDA